ncbi:retrotransposon protein, putative, ty1-copia subclass [Tanacetum coccineum]
MDQLNNMNTLFRTFCIERQLRIVLSTEDKLDYLEQPIPPASVPAQAGQQVAPEALVAHTAWVKGSKEIDRIMLMTMESDIQQNLEKLSAYDMLQELKTLFAQQAEQELLQTVRDFHSCKQEEGQFVSSYILKIKSYIDNLERLGHPVSLNLGVSLILISLREEFNSFVQNYNMHNIRNTVNELHAMLKLYEQTLTKKDHALHAIRAGKVQKKNNKQKKPQVAARGQNQGKGKRKLAYAPQPKIPPSPKRENPAKDSIYHQCGDTEVQGLRGSRKLKPGALSLYVDNGQRATVEAIRTYHLCLPSRLHCRLGHISKKRIEKLQHDGLLNSTDLRAFEICVPCMSGKMARKPYTHQVERAKDLLGLIHTDVVAHLESCQDKEQATSSLSLTNLVIMGEYISQEFLDHLKDHGIIAHCTHPYTPQHNGVSESRNRTLLDMVRSTMSQTTLPKSFWDYSLVTAARILNMVPTKKVENTPYKVWHGQAPKLSYLKVSLDDLEIIQEEGTHPSIDTSSHHQEDDLEIDEPQSDIIPIRRSTRTRHAPDRMCLYSDAEEHELWDLGEPANYKAALLDPESDKCKTVGSKWLFKKKTGMDGVVHTFKAHLVTKGFTQTYRVDYEETFSPIADIRAIRILIAIAAYYDYEIWQMDVKTAFLNRHLSEEVYMEQPEGFINSKYLNRKVGFTQNRDESCVYLKASGSYVTFLILYVDDILIMGNHILMLQDVKYYLGRCFAMKDLGEAAYIFGIKIYRDRLWRLIGLCQSAYIEKILKRFHMENSKCGSILMQEKLRLSKSQCALTPAEFKRMKNVPYASAIGSIMYVVRCTRPDVAFAQNITSLFQQNPGDLHWTTVKNILKYLRNTKDMFLVYKGGIKRELRVSCYTDAGYLTDADDLKSQIGYVFVLNGGAIDWKSTKQNIFATSSAEVEYIAAYNASKEAVWVRKFISGLGVVPTIKKPINMYCDNTRAITIANESGITKGARHFRAKVYYLREVIEYGDIKLEKVHTDDNLADPFTKVLAFPKHSEHTRNIGMLPARWRHLNVGDGSRRDETILHMLCILNGLLYIVMEGLEIVDFLLNTFSFGEWCSLRVEKVKALGAKGVVKGSRLGVVWMMLCGGIESARVVSRVLEVTRKNRNQMELELEDEVFYPWSSDRRLFYWREGSSHDPQAGNH